jgi:hypothetical protein
MMTLRRILPLAMLVPWILTASESAATPVARGIPPVPGSEMLASANVVEEPFSPTPRPNLDSGFYGKLYGRYKGQVLDAVKAGDKDKVARLTDQFNQSIGGRLLFVAVMRTVPGEDQLVLVRKSLSGRDYLDVRINYADNADPHVTKLTRDGRTRMLIETGGRKGGPYADNLYLTLLMDPLVLGSPAPAPANEDDLALYHRYLKLVREAGKAGNKDEVARLTYQFNESIGGRLLQIYVTRIVPGEKSLPLIGRSFTVRELAASKINFAKREDVHVTQHTHDGRSHVRIESGGLPDGRYADDLYVHMYLEPRAEQPAAK